MKNPNELTLGQMIILENEYNDIIEEIQNLEKYVAENDSHEGAAYRILHCTGALSEVSKIANLLGYRIVPNETTHRYSLCER